MLLVNHQRIDTGTGGLGNKRTNGDHTNYSIIKIGQNIEVYSGALRKLAVIQTLVRNHRLTMKWKTQRNYGYEYMYLPAPSYEQYTTQCQFLREVNRFRCRIFLLRDHRQHQSWRALSTALITHTWRKNLWMQTFPRSINAKCLIERH